MSWLRGLLLLLGVVAIVYALAPFPRQPNANISAEEIAKCKVQVRQLFDNVVERTLIPRFAIRKGDARTYYARAYLFLGIPYDGAVIGVLEPYDETQRAEKKYFEQWNCEGSVTRIGFRQAAP